MDKRKILESLRTRLEKEKEERFKLFTRLRKHLPHIVGIITEFNVETIVLFGSITNRERFTEDSDIDIGIIGVNKEDFFKVYSRLTDQITWPIDLVDLDDDPTFKTMVLDKGEIIYDRRREDNKNLSL